MKTSKLTVSDNWLSSENKIIWNKHATILKAYYFFFLIHSDDYLKILQEGRKVRTLSGVYRYSLFGWGNYDDDDCDGDDLDGDGDKDGEDGEWGEDDEYDSEERPRKRFYPSVHRFPSPAGNRFGFPKRAPIGAPYVTRVLIPGTGELVSIIFKADDDDVTEKGFQAVYRVRPGVLMIIRFFTWK